MDKIQVYSDASISPAIMEDLSTSKLGSLVGRIAILIPELDYGLIEQIKDGVVDAHGNPASTQLEIVAVKRAKEICTGKRISDYQILTDNKSAAEESGVPEARWLEEGRIHPASLFLERIMNRARYLRHSSRKVLNRVGPNMLQQEMFDLFTSPSSEIQLSKSLLWGKLRMERSVSDSGEL